MHTYTIVYFGFWSGQLSNFDRSSLFVFTAAWQYDLKSHILRLLQLCKLAGFFFVGVPSSYLVGNWAWLTEHGSGTCEDYSWFAGWSTNIHNDLKVLWVSSKLRQLSRVMVVHFMVLLLWCVVMLLCLLVYKPMNMFFFLSAPNQARQFSDLVIWIASPCKASVVGYCIYYNMFIYVHISPCTPYMFPLWTPFHVH